ncbi:MAG: hypothetical protein OXC03_02975 [Flavobacteriaceae bacterium]|nr:hypothetical protein [Flavobacteriaceae bacterium]
MIKIDTESNVKGIIGKLKHGDEFECQGLHEWVEFFNNHYECSDAKPYFKIYSVDESIVDKKNGLKYQLSYDSWGRIRGTRIID